MKYIFRTILAIVFIRGLRKAIAKRKEDKARKERTKEYREEREAEKRRIKESNTTTSLSYKP